MKQIHALSPFDFCPWCIQQLRAGVPDNGICGHEVALHRAYETDPNYDGRYESYVRTAETPDGE